MAAPPQKNPLHVPSPFRVQEPAMTPEQKEQQYVHDVYQVIAPHFSATRYKPWPVVEEFLTTMPPGYVGADVGCGNGKYIGVNPKLFMVGSDRSSNLISICGERGHEAMVCDGLSLPYRPEFFDFAISIAVIHHFISPERRVAAIEEILRVVRLGGRVLIFVWALEQTGKRDFDKDVQDVFVPWAMPKKAEPKIKVKAPSRPQGVKKKDRKKHPKGGEEGDKEKENGEEEAKKEGEANETTATETTAVLAQALQDVSLDKKEDHKAEMPQEQEGGSSSAPAGDAATALSSSSAPASNAQQQPQESSASPSSATSSPEAAAPVYNRYYHLFQKGELEDLITKTNKATIVQNGYDRDNWWCILEKTSN
ncbi:alkylated DNA repair protein alkB homolog 8 [Entomortierella parvispora]|uniref:Alkylated DNA repair protein alkB homolog 8 n=1 Tax=Entomortierella parvispora TaxID=205924 RepID=A0A9P3HFR2_9FUNG|nr:alkylated DNA repair protein alkB homolog 8 [Entomortierella parvispora]